MAEPVGHASIDDANFIQDRILTLQHRHACGDPRPLSNSMKQSPVAASPRRWPPLPDASLRPSTGTLRSRQRASPFRGPIDSRLGPKRPTAAVTNLTASSDRQRMTPAHPPCGCASGCGRSAMPPPGVQLVTGSRRGARLRFGISIAPWSGIVDG